jgi:hypothetical protein
MSVRGTRPIRSHLSLKEHEKQTIIKMWNEFKGSGAIATHLNLHSATVSTFLVNNGYKRTRQEQLEGYRRLRDERLEGKNV